MAGSYALVVSPAIHDSRQGTPNTRSRIRYRHGGFEPTKPGVGGQR
jgi:hypothetical protein